MDFAAIFAGPGTAAMVGGLVVVAGLYAVKLVQDRASLASSASARAEARRNANAIAAHLNAQQGVGQQGRRKNGQFDHKTYGSSDNVNL